MYNELPMFDDKMQICEIWIFSAMKNVFFTKSTVGAVQKFANGVHLEKYSNNSYLGISLAKIGFDTSQKGQSKVPAAEDG